MSADRIESAVAEWLELQAAGTPPELAVFARERGLELTELLPVLDNARWLVGRHQATRDGTPSPVPQPPFELDGVRVLAEAGRGGMGVVFRGEQVELGRTVAVKVFDPSLHGPAAQGRVRFLNEARAAARLSHAHVVRILQVGETRGLAWFAMEWVEGETLAQILARRAAAPPPGPRGARFREVATLIAKVAHGVQHAHDAGLLHRDVKPGNILVDTAGEPRLADFGLVRDLGSATLTGTGEVVGSPPYMSPEQVRGARALTPRVDVYGLGVTLYECLALRRPFRGPDPETLRREILAATVVPPRTHEPELPLDLQWICLRAMAREPQVRYPSAAALAADLEAFARNEPVNAGPPSTRLRLRRALRQHQASLTIVAVLLAFAGVIGIAWRSRLHQSAAELASARSRVAVARVTEDRSRLFEVLSAAIAAHPDEPSFLLQRAVPLLAEGQLDPALRDLARAQELSPGDPELADVVRASRAAAVLCAGKTLAPADEQALARIARVEPVRSLTLHLRGALLGFLGRWAEAEPLLRAAAERDRSLGAEADLLVAYQALGRMAEAWLALDRFTASRESPLLWFHRCRLAVVHRSLVRARAELDTLEARAPDSAFTAAAQILVGITMGDGLDRAEAALARARAAADWNDASGFVEHVMAQAYHVADRPGKAIPLWESLLERQPRNASLRSLLGITLLQLSARRRGTERETLRRRALAELERAVEDSSHRPLERDYHRGQFLFFSGRTAEAVASLRAATRVAPGESQRWRPLAAALLTLAGATGDEGQRLQLLEESAGAQGQEAALSPEDPRAQELHRQALLRLAEAYETAGDARAAEVRGRLAPAPGTRPAR